MKEGKYIQHRTRSEWGVGLVLSRTGDRAQVQFDHGLVLLDLRVAEPLFEQVPTPDAATVAHLTGSSGKPATRTRRATVKNATAKTATAKTATAKTATAKK